jgi:hypothetical protein
MTSLLLTGLVSIVIAQDPASPRLEFGGGVQLRYSVDSYRLGGDAIEGHDGTITGVDGNYGLLLQTRLTFLDGWLIAGLSGELSPVNHRYLAHKGSSNLGSLQGFGLGFTPSLSLGLIRNPASVTMELGLGFGVFTFRSQGNPVRILRPQVQISLAHHINENHSLGLEVALAFNGFVDLGVSQEAVTLYLELTGIGDNLSLRAFGASVSVSVVYRFGLNLSSSAR